MGGALCYQPNTPSCWVSHSPVGVEWTNRPCGVGRAGMWCFFLCHVPGQSVLHKLRRIDQTWGGFNECLCNECSNERNRRKPSLICVPRWVLMKLMRLKRSMNEQNSTKGQFWELGTTRAAAAAAAAAGVWVKGESTWIDWRTTYGICKDSNRGWLVGICSDSISLRVVFRDKEVLLMTRLSWTTVRSTRANGTTNVFIGGGMDLAKISL